MKDITLSTQAAAPVDLTAEERKVIELYRRTERDFKDELMRFLVSIVAKQANKKSGLRLIDGGRAQ